MTIIDHPRRFYVEVEEGWTGPPADRVGMTNPDEVTTRWEWDTDLTPEQEQAFLDVVGAARAGMSTERFVPLKPELVRLRAYYLDDTPTNAESVQAIKDIIRVLRMTLGED